MTMKKLSLACKTTAFGIAACLSLAGLPGTASAATLNVTNPNSGDDIGTFGIGTNIVSGIVDGVCDDFGFGGIECYSENVLNFGASLAAGTELTSVTATQSNATGVMVGATADTLVGTNVNFFEMFTGTSGELLTSSVVGSGQTTTYRMYNGIGGNAGGDFSFTGTLTFEVGAIAAVPLPASSLLLLAGLGGLGVAARRKRTA